MPDLLADQLADDETIRQRAAGDRTDVAVTDRRLVRVDGTNRPDDATSRSVLLVSPHVTGVEIDRESGSDKWQTYLGLAILASLVAVAGLVVRNDLGAALLLIGALGAFLMIFAAVLEYGQDRGTVSVVVEFSGRDGEEFTLPSDGGTAVAEEIATVVGEARSDSAA